MNTAETMAFRRLRIFIGLPVLEKVLFFKICFFLMYYRATIRFGSLKRVLAYAEKMAVQGDNSFSPIGPEIIVRHVAAASRIIPLSNCFSRALTARRYLASNGYATRLHIGVAKGDEKENPIKGHAWISQDGAVLVGQLPDLESYREVLVIDQ